MYSLQNDAIKISVAAKGAELQSLCDINNSQEYIWGGDPAFWAKHAPILFPIVGTLKNNTYYYNNKSYQLNRHGFARDMDFQLWRRTENSLCFLLTDTKATLDVYPFPFNLFVTYSIKDKTLRVNYRIVNTGNTEMYFSIGGHPAFRVPIFKGDAYTDYLLEFNRVENAGSWPITAEGLLEASSSPFFKASNIINLKKSLFYKDALVFKHLNSNQVKLLSANNVKGLEFNFEGFPFLGIWAAKDADFVCIEPWCGIADTHTTHQQLADKEGINRLAMGQSFERTWRVTLLT